MISQDEFRTILLEEFPALKSALPESYPPTNALMCFAAHAQTAIRQGDQATLRKCFALADRCLREGEPGLKEKLTDYFLVQLSPAEAQAGQPRGFLRKLFGTAPTPGSSQILTSCMTPAVVAAWQAAELERKGTRTELEFIEQTKLAFPDLGAPPVAVAFLINPYLNRLLERTQRAIDSGDLESVRKVFQFMLPFLVEGIALLRWCLVTIFLEALEFRGPHAEKARAVLPKNIQDALNSIANKRKAQQEEAGKATAEADARRAVNYPRIPEPFQSLVRRIDELTDIEFVPASAEQLAWLRQLGLPESIVNFYARANPSHFVEGWDATLLPAQAVGRAEPGDWMASLVSLRLVVFATSPGGDAYCFDVRDSVAPNGLRVVQLSHDWGDPEEARTEFVSEFYEKEKGSGKTREALETEYWQLFWEAVKPVSDSFEDFLRLFIRELEEHQD
jgi:hypothetical protein